MVFFLLSATVVESLLLSDLPTPCFIIDTQALQRIALAPTDSSSCNITPSLRLPSNGVVFHPHPVTSKRIDAKYASTASTVVDITFPIGEDIGQPSIGFLHSSVTRARGETSSKDDPVATFLAEIDLDPKLCGEECPPAKLVLGLNNHHVGSYYWARSAGSGASMEAPGVLFGPSHNKNMGILRWIDQDGPIACNSNDGKRSEWVNFLRTGDTVQLVPMNGQEAMIRMSAVFSLAEECRIFGITSEGRPMGSEPQVICKWLTVK